MVALVHPAIHEPAPVEGRLHGDAGELPAIRRKRRHRPVERVRQTPLHDSTILPIGHYNHVIVGMQVDPAVRSLDGLLSLG